MKKIFLLFVAAMVSAGIMSAQDINQATENYNNGVMELDMGNKDAAVTCFQTALSMAENLGDEGAELAANCKNIIPNVMLSIAKDFIKAENYDGAVEQLNKTAETAELYGLAETASEAKDMIPTVFLSKGNVLLKAKNVAGAIEAFQQVLALDPANGMASLLLLAQGNVAEAEAAYLQASANGQETNAKKQLLKMFQRLAQASLKAKKYQETIDYATKANSYVEDATSYKFAASAAQQLGKNADCISYYEKYLELNPNAKDAAGVKFTIAALYQQAGNKAKAKEFYQMVANDPQYGTDAQEQLKTL